MKLNRVIAAAAAALFVLTGCAHNATETSPAPDAATLAIGRKVADWQLARMENFDYIRTYKDEAALRRGWIQGAFYTGLTALADATGEARYTGAVMAHGASENWDLGTRPYYADDHVIGQTWVWAYGKRKDARMIAPMRKGLDAILAAPSTVGLTYGVQPSCQDRWCWSDALYMAPAAWTGLAKATGESRYRDFADREFWATTDFLYDKDEHLYYRDSRYIPQRDAKGRKIFWSRGNGWAYAGLVNVLKTLPADYPSRPRYEALYRQMSERLVTLQKADGYWASSLLATEDATPETSGAGFFTYGLAWGVNTGRLDAAAYAPSVARGWKALVAAVQPDGKLVWVQQVGAEPGKVEPTDTQLYGTGAFLLAATEVAVCPSCRR